MTSTTEPGALGRWPPSASSWSSPSWSLACSPSMFTSGSEGQSKSRHKSRNLSGPSLLSVNPSFSPTAHAKHARVCFECCFLIYMILLCYARLFDSHRLIFKSIFAPFSETIYSNSFISMIYVCKTNIYHMVGLKMFCAAPSSSNIS